MQMRTGTVAAASAFAAAMLGAILGAGAAELSRYDLALVDGRLARAEDTIRVEAGDTVVLVWTSDRPAELHLHGYGVLIEVKPDAPGKMRFAATTAGRFPVETHDPDGRHRVVLYVEVYPE